MTTTKTVLATLLLVVSPTLASASCAFGEHEKVTMTCIEGSTWDPVTRTCIKSTS